MNSQVDVLEVHGGWWAVGHLTQDSFCVKQHTPQHDTGFGSEAQTPYLFKLSLFFVYSSQHYQVLMKICTLFLRQLDWVWRHGIVKSRQTHRPANGNVVGACLYFAERYNSQCKVAEAYQLAMISKHNELTLRPPNNVIQCFLLVNVPGCLV